LFTNIVLTAVLLVIVNSIFYSAAKASAIHPQIRENC